MHVCSLHKNNKKGQITAGAERGSPPLAGADISVSPADASAAVFVAATSKRKFAIEGVVSNVAARALRWTTSAPAMQ